MNVSDFYGKRAASAGGRSGYVLSVNANGDKVECLTCVDDDEREFTVDIKDVISVGEEILFDDREKAVKTAKPVRLGRAAFDAKGKYLGDVCDATIENGKLSKIKIGKKLIPCQNLCFGDAVILKEEKTLKSDVLKDGKVILKKGTAVNKKTLTLAAEQGEYVQTNLKTI